MTEQCLHAIEVLSQMEEEFKQHSDFVDLIKNSKEKIKKLVKKFSEILFKYECLIASKWASKAHEHLMWSQWRILPQPEFFDHQIDLYYQWLEKRDSLWLERGVFSGLAMKNGSVLE